MGRGVEIEKGFLSSETRFGREVYCARGQEMREPCFARGALDGAPRKGKPRGGVKPPQQAGLLLGRWDKDDLGVRFGVGQVELLGYLPVKREAERLDCVSWRAFSCPWRDLSRRWNSASMNFM
jgi:hypothetical protein